MTQCAAFKRAFLKRRLGRSESTSRTPEGRSATFGVRGFLVCFSSLVFVFLFSFVFFVFDLNCCTISCGISYVVEKNNCLNRLGRYTLEASFFSFFVVCAASA